MSTMTMELCIYANSPLGSGPARPPRAIPGADHRARRALPVSTATLIENELIRILEAMPESGESVQQAYDGKELALKVLFDTLTSDECTRLHASLSDERIVAFRRLSAERRARVLNALMHAAKRRDR